MEQKIKNAIEEYQCSGCISGSNISCFEKNKTGGIGCGKHFSGTIISGVGKILLGMPKGFNRLGKEEDLKPNIYETYDDCDWQFDMWNIPVWKHLDKNGNTLVRGIMPRRNEPFIHIFLEDCMDKVNCLEITQEQINSMD